MRTNETTPAGLRRMRRTSTRIGRTSTVRPPTHPLANADVQLRHIILVRREPPRVLVPDRLERLVLRLAGRKGHVEDVGRNEGLGAAVHDRRADDDPVDAGF